MLLIDNFVVAPTIASISFRDIQRQTLLLGRESDNNIRKKKTFVTYREIRRFVIMLI